MNTNAIQRRLSLNLGSRSEMGTSFNGRHTRIPLFSWGLAKRQDSCAWKAVSKLQPLTGIASGEGFIRRTMHMFDAIEGNHGQTSNFDPGDGPLLSLLAFSGRLYPLRQRRTQTLRETLHKFPPHSQ